MVLVEKETGKSYVPMYEEKHHKKEYASKGVAGTALGLGIAGTALALLNGGLNGCGNGVLGVFGGNRCCCGNGNIGTTAAMFADAADNRYLERKECEDYVTLVNGLWERSYNQQKERFSDRQVINQEMFGIYSAMRNGFDAINAKHNADLFALYKSTRDDKDSVLAEVGALRTEVAVMKAIRPYQDKLIQCDIDNVAKDANFNLFRRTCRMISGEVVLPNTPVVTGFGSYNTCGCRNSSVKEIE